MTDTEGTLPGLNAQERDLLQKMFSDPLSIPPEWKAWLVSYLEANPPQLPISNIGGSRGWQSYTPAWTATGTAPVLGNGTLTGRYVQLGKTIMGHLSLVAGSTTTFGTGNFRFTLPGTIATTMRGSIGVADCVDVSAGAAYVGFTNLVSGTIVEIWTPQSPIGVWQQGAVAPPATPFIWANGDQLRLKFMYESL